MKIEIILNQAITEYGKNMCLHETLLYSVNIGGIIKYFKTESGAYNYLFKLGYRYNYNDGFYYKEVKSNDENKHERHFINAINK